MRIGIDLDGVIVDFVPAYQQLHVELTGRDTFLPGDNIDPPSWNWPQMRGYSKGETTVVWETIKADPHFWRRLQPQRPAYQVFSQAYERLTREHELYFITTRTGVACKRQTEEWLVNWVVGLDRQFPTVLIAQHRKKGQIAAGLGLDCYIDDNYDNATDVVRDSPKTRTYLLNRRYNEQGVQSTVEIEGIPHPTWYKNSMVEDRRVMSVAEFLATEGLA